MTDTRSYVARKARVYRFGTRWHWNCGRGQCLGGPKRTQVEAFAAAFDHVREEHIKAYPAGWFKDTEHSHVDNDYVCGNRGL